GDLTADLLRTIFSPKSPLHDGAVVVRGSRILAAGALLPLGETTIHSERFGTRHRAALGTTEQTDAIVVVVSEENGQVSLVQRGRPDDVSRIIRFVVHNWPLKLAAIVLATLLYGGLVLSQTTQDFTRAVPIGIENAPSDVVVLSDLGSVTRIRYVAPPNLGLR